MKTRKNCKTCAKAGNCWLERAVMPGILRPRDGCAIWLPSGCLDVGWEAERIMVQDDNEEGSRKNV